MEADVFTKEEGRLPAEFMEEMILAGEELGPGMHETSEELESDFSAAGPVVGFADEEDPFLNEDLDDMEFRQEEFLPEQDDEE